MFPTPFVPGTPHPLAARAAEAMKGFLTEHPFVKPSMFEGPRGGKMMGVLVVQLKNTSVGYLRGFAGTLGGRWVVDGCVPPAFDVDAFERLWSRGGDQISSIDAEIVQAKAASPAMEERVRELTTTQRDLSRSLHAELHATYAITNALGQTASLRSLFERHSPPGGAGDCAAVKLIAHAFAIEARPLALAEFWWGPPPPAGGRHHGVFYPACRGKCSKILPFMLEGIPCEPAPDFGIKPVGDDAPRVVHEDATFVVVDKPSGLLSVPGRGAGRRDCAERRLQARHRDLDGAWPRLVHRLDLATSGLLLAAKNKATYVALQRQFSEHAIEKRYVALLRGHVADDGGVISLPLRGDLEDRPRQMFDPEHGKPATTRWEVLDRSVDTTRVALYPKTGRTHQLRLHVVHPMGLGTPIVGDWLYGYGGERLMLHAESLAFTHPTTGERLNVCSPAPF